MKVEENCDLPPLAGAEAKQILMSLPHIVAVIQKLQKIARRIISNPGSKIAATEVAGP
jgi:hypothetical protein